MRGGGDVLAGGPGGRVVGAPGQRAGRGKGGGRGDADNLEGEELFPGMSERMGGGSVELADSADGHSVAEVPPSGEHHGEVMAVGDADVDMPMFEYAGLSVALSNAAPEVQAAAQVVAPHVDDDGAAWAITEYALAPIRR